jgi:hypothetical protein
VETFNVMQNDPVDQTYAFTTIPGLSVTVYAGTTFTESNGTHPDPFPLAAIQVPVDRLPDVMPVTSSGVGAFIVAFQPAETVASQAVAVWFPNTLNTPPGTDLPLMTLDPTLGRMVPYGTGTVSADGTTIIPDINPSAIPKRYGIVHFDWHGPLAGPPNENDPPPDPNPPCSCDPVDLATGLDVITSTDISFSGNRGSIAFTRTYRTNAVHGNVTGPFGWGGFDNYEYRLDTLTPQTASVINLVMPNGTRIPFNLQASGKRDNDADPEKRFLLSIHPGFPAVRLHPCRGWRSERKRNHNRQGRGAFSDHRNRRPGGQEACFPIQRLYDFADYRSDWPHRQLHLQRGWLSGDFHERFGRRDKLPVRWEWKCDAGDGSAWSRHH